MYICYCGKEIKYDMCIRNYELLLLEELLYKY